MQWYFNFLFSCVATVTRRQCQRSALYLQDCAVRNRYTSKMMYGSEEVGHQFAKDHGVNDQVAQLQGNRRGRRISVMHAFLPILATIVLEFRIFLPKKFVLSKML